MAFAIVGAVIGAASSAYKIVDGAAQAKIAKEEAGKAKIEYERNKELFAGLDTSNPYANLENTMEDLTVDKQAAEFQKQQQMQSQANIMDQMKGAAGSSGIAGLAQAMANQGSLDAQKASADIARQESANQKLQAQEASRIQSQERQGEVMSREMERSKVTGLLGMSQTEMAQAEAKRAAANEAIASGIGGLATAATGLAEYKPAKTTAETAERAAGTTATRLKFDIMKKAEDMGLSYEDYIEQYGPEGDV